MVECHSPGLIWHTDSGHWPGETWAPTHCAWCQRSVLSSCGGFKPCTCVFVFFFGTDVLTVTHKTAARCCLHSALVVGSFCLAVEKMKSQDVVWNLVLLVVWTAGCKLCFQQLYESKDHSGVVIKNSGTSTRGGVKECVGVKKWCMKSSDIKGTRYPNSDLKHLLFRWHLLLSVLNYRQVK